MSEEAKAPYMKAAEEDRLRYRKEVEEFDKPEAKAERAAAKERAKQQAEEEKALQVIPTPSHLLGRISPIFLRFFPLFARLHRLVETVPTSPKPEPRAKKPPAQVSKQKHRFGGLANSGGWERFAGRAAAWNHALNSAMGRTHEERRKQFEGELPIQIANDGHAVAWNHRHSDVEAARYEILTEI